MSFFFYHCLFGVRIACVFWLFLRSMDSTKVEKKVCESVKWIKTLFIVVCHFNNANIQLDYNFWWILTNSYNPLIRRNQTVNPWTHWYCLMKYAWAQKAIWFIYGHSIKQLTRYSYPDSIVPYKQNMNQHKSMRMSMTMPNTPHVCIVIRMVCVYQI